MGVRILSVDGGGDTCLFDSTTGWAIGPVADEETLSEFLKWCAETDLPDLRKLTEIELGMRWAEFLGITKVNHEAMHLVSEED